MNPIAAERARAEIDGLRKRIDHARTELAAGEANVATWQADNARLAREIDMSTAAADLLEDALEARLAIDPPAPIQPLSVPPITGLGRLLAPVFGSIS